MSKEDINTLKESKDIKFIYSIPCSLFDSKIEYIIVGDVLTKIEDNVRQFSFESWFELMDKGSLLSYMCAISDRKHKIKEFLNIYDKPDLLKFRKYVLTEELPDKEVIQECLWACQIITEFRVNRPDVFVDKITKGEALSRFLELVDPMYKYKIENG